MKSLITDTLRHWNTHHASRMGAALSYYAMLSFVPFLLLLSSLATSFFSTEVVHGTLTTQLARWVGSGAAGYIDTVLQSTTLQTVTISTAVISIVVALFGAVGVFSELEQDFDLLWGTPKRRKTHTSFWRAALAYVYKKLITLAFVPLVLVLLILIIGVTVFFGVVEHYVLFSPLITLFIQILAPFIFGTVLFFAIYRLLPTRTLPWRELLVGAMVSTGLFILGNTLILTYIKLLVHTDVFGGAASLVGLLVWIYYSAQVCFVGASFTYIYAQYRGVIPPHGSTQS